MSTPECFRNGAQRYRRRLAAREVASYEQIENRQALVRELQRRSMLREVLDCLGASGGEEKAPLAAVVGVVGQAVTRLDNRAFEVR